MAMTQASGVVTKLYSRKAGNRGGAIYSFIINDDGIWFNCGFDNPGVEEGESIEFEWEEEEYQPGKVSNKVDVSTLSKVSKAKQDVPVKKAVSQAVGKSNSRDSYWEDKAVEDKIRQNIISYQAAFNTATNVVDVFFKNCEGDVFEKLVGKTPKKQLGNFLTIVEGVAEDIFDKYLHGDVKAKDILQQENKAGIAVEEKGSASLDD